MFWNNIGFNAVEGGGGSDGLSGGAGVGTGSPNAGNSGASGSASQGTSEGVTTPAFSYDTWDGSDTSLPDTYKPAHSYYTAKSAESEAKYAKELADRDERHGMLKDHVSKLEANYNKFLIEGMHPEYDELRKTHAGVVTERDTTLAERDAIKADHEALQNAYRVMDEQTGQREYSRWKDANKDLYSDKNKPIMKDLVAKLGEKVDLDELATLTRANSTVRQTAIDLINRGTPVAVALDIANKNAAPTRLDNPAAAAASSRLNTVGATDSSSEQRAGTLVSLTDKVKDAARRNFRQA